MTSKVTVTDIMKSVALGEFNYPIHSKLAADVFGLPATHVDALEEFEKLVIDRQPTTNVFITPAAAEDILNNLNEANRSLGIGAKNKYRNDMSADLWAPLASTLAFDVEGLLRDGQHRLKAVVESGKGQWFKVQTHMPEDVIRSVDLGRKRNVGDLLSFLGYGKATSRKIAQAIEIIYAVNIGAFGRNAHSLQGITAASKLEFAEVQRGLLGKVAFLAERQSYTCVPVPALMALPFLVEEAYFDKAIQFADEVTSGQSTGLTDPRNWVNRRCEKDSSGRNIVRKGGGFGSLADKEHVMGLVFRAWGRWLEGLDIPANTAGTNVLARSKAAAAKSGNGVFNDDIFRPKFYYDHSLVSEDPNAPEGDDAVESEDSE